MEFIFVPLIIAICTAGFYGVVELLVHRKERLKIIEKMGSDINLDFLAPQFPPRRMNPNPSGISYGTLKAIGLLMGIGVGLILAFLINYNTLLIERLDPLGRETREIIYGASVLFFGGLGLLISFIVEVRMKRKKN